MTYTVVAVYEDNHQVFVDHIKAPDPKEAAARLKRRQMFKGYAMHVLCVFEGRFYDLYGKDELMEAM